MLISDHKRAHLASSEVDKKLRLVDTEAHLAFGDLRSQRAHLASGKVDAALRLSDHKEALKNKVEGQPHPAVSEMAAVLYHTDLIHIIYNKIFL